MRLFFAGPVVVVLSWLAGMELVKHPATDDISMNVALTGITLGAVMTGVGLVLWCYRDLAERRAERSR